uniref:Zf-RVT domain-containing protein n=1 Tax=Anopheles epiroticus TaxID=199890 RepID=A0A182P7I7_9DIPT
MLQILVKYIETVPITLNTTTTTKNIAAAITKSQHNAKITEESTSRNWSRVWFNINRRQIGSEQKSQMYLLINNKVPNAVDLFRHHRVNSPKCSYCNMDETMEHKFSSCQRIHP